MLSPCIYCRQPRRHPGCHDSCPDKKDWDEKRNKIKSTINADRNKDRLAASYEIEGRLGRKRSAMRQKGKW